MAYDWPVIRSDYINGGMSFRDLAAKHGANKDVIARKARKEGWSIQRSIQVDKMYTECLKKSVEKISDTLSEEAATEARARSLAKRIGLRLLEKVEESEDTNDYRRVVQCLVDMGMFDRGGTENAGGVTIVDDIPKPRKSD